VFDPGLGTGPGRLFLQSLWIRRDDRDRREFPRDPGAIPKNPRKNKRREEFPAPGGGLIAGKYRESRKTGLKTGQI
jgi:hypothetical protein